jgi:S1-C subfamily serine protease
VAKRSTARSSRVRSTHVLLLGLPVASADQGSPAGTCPGGEPPRGTLGITRFVCHCTLRTDPAGEEGTWSFHIEPEILTLAEAGPADGVLEEGDLVVAIDGHLITTAAGGQRWSRIRPGEEVHLRIRRGTAIREAVVRAASHCPGDSPEAAPGRAADRPLGKRLLPRGGIGIELTCDCLVEAGQDHPLWTIHRPPEVNRVVAGGPAARTGLREGDRLLRIDGLKLDTAAGGRTFSMMAPGSAVTFLVERAGRTRTVEVLPEELPLPGP